MSLLKRDAEENNTIVLSVNEDRAPYKEAIALSTIKPGYLLEINASGATDEEFRVRAFNNGAGQTCQKIFAVENTRYGKTIDDSYSTGDRVMFRACRPGDVIMAYVAVDPSYPLAVGTFLCPDTSAGHLVNIGDAVVTTLYPGGVAAISMEARTTGVSSLMIKVQIV